VGGLKLLKVVKVSRLKAGREGSGEDWFLVFQSKKSFLLSLDLGWNLSLNLFIFKFNSCS